MSGGPSRTRLGDRVYAWSFGGESIEESYGANCGAVLGRDAVLLVDPFIAPAPARKLEGALREVTALPVRFVVLTHHHTDHALGAGYFAAAGAEVIAHAGCAARMAAEHPGLIASRRRQPEIAELFRDASAYSPSRTFEDAVDLDLGGRSVHVFHPGPNHTPGDAVVVVPEESVVFCGDLVSNGYHVNYEDAAVENLREGIATLRSLGAAAYVPGHGKPGSMDLLDAQLRYHSTVRDAVVSGKDPDRRIREALPDHRLGLVVPSGLQKDWSRY